MERKFHIKEKICFFFAVCPEGSYGNNCTMRCNCSASERCDNVIGCCDPDKDQCRLPKSDALLKSKARNEWLLGILLASLLAVGVLLFGTIFYRKKYIKEKDPDLPVFTYHPRPQAVLDEIESREFNNPLYRQSAINSVPVKIIGDDRTPIARSTQLRSGPLMSKFFFPKFLFFKSVHLL
ncbi:unnamed protein product [Gongylonema pulchrum]|uniref:Disintegrin domain-containing protein n=1 Tax=Gongylonema pulchrum TaxID=637853 RepID=A0A183CWA9_9BILA|nr:unnamed protein product [Gongylonema pulchrum]